MIEITADTLEARIIKLLQKTYPITIVEIEQKLHIPRKQVEWVLQKFQVKGIVKLEPLPDKTYVRLLRHDFRFLGQKQQRKLIKQTSDKKKQKTEEYEGFMYS